MSSHKSITFVGRASALTFREFESGVTLAGFTLTVKRHDPARPELVVRCEGYGMKRATAFARQWDEAWSVVIGGKVPPLLRRNYLSALAEASNGPSRQDIIEAGV